MIAQTIPITPDTIDTLVFLENHATKGDIIKPSVDISIVITNAKLKFCLAGVIGFGSGLLYPSANFLSVTDFAGVNPFGSYAWLQ